jgi:hypothetical protein
VSGWQALCCVVGCGGWKPTAHRRDARPFMSNAAGGAERAHWPPPRLATHPPTGGGRFAAGAGAGAWQQRGGPEVPQPLLQAAGARRWLQRCRSRRLWPSARSPGHALPLARLQLIAAREHTACVRHAAARQQLPTKQPHPSPRRSRPTVRCRA